MFFFCISLESLLKNLVALNAFSCAKHSFEFTPSDPLLSFNIGGVRQVRNPNTSQVSQPHSAPRADAAPPEWRRAQRLHHALSDGPAGAQPLPVQSGGRDQPGKKHTHKLDLKQHMGPLRILTDKSLKAKS